MITPTLDLEVSFWNQGLQYICGLDEVGRGCFAGSVVVGAVVFPKNFKLFDGLRDSKLLGPGQREVINKLVKKHALMWGIEEISVEVINKVGINQATQIAFYNVVQNLDKFPDHMLIDAFYIANIEKNKQTPVKNGDKICASIAAASVIAKVYRDNLMLQISEEYPEYNFAKNKGYGTKQHRDAIKKHGLSSLHRTSFNLTKFLF